MVIFEEIENTLAQATNNDLSGWYNEFKNPAAGANVAEPEKKEVKKANPILSDLMLYSYQLKAYTQFINDIAQSIENDVRADIVADNTIPIVPIVSSEAPVQPTQPAFKPLAFAVKNREGFVTAAENINELAKAVDSILSRVKGIE